MKKITALFILTLLSQTVIGQADNQEPHDTSFKVIKKHIYRIILTQPMLPDYEALTLAGMTENKLGSVFSLVGRLGVGSSIRRFSNYNNYQFSFLLYGSIETRYYFTLERRQRKEKTIQNFSCPYLSLEQNLFTNPVLLINQPRKDAFEGSTKTFLNVGYQKQFGGLYLGIFLGASIWSRDFSKFDVGRNMDALHGGLSVGYIF